MLCPPPPHTLLNPACPPPPPLCVLYQVIKEKGSQLSRGYGFVSFAHPIYATIAMQHMNQQVGTEKRGLCGRGGGCVRGIVSRGQGWGRLHKCEQVERVSSCEAATSVFSRLAKPPLLTTIPSLPPPGLHPVAGAVWALCR